MDYRQEISGDTLNVHMKGKFTFSDHERFRKVLAPLAQKELKTISLDMSGIEFVDSAALGMLLIAREESQKNSVSLVLRNPSEAVDKIFKVSNFYSLFTIDGK